MSQIVNYLKESHFKIITIREQWQDRPRRSLATGRIAPGVPLHSFHVWIFILYFDQTFNYDRRSPPRNKHTLCEYEGSLDEGIVYSQHLKVQAPGTLQCRAFANANCWSNVQLTPYILYRAIKCANVRDIGFLEVSVEESLVLVCTFALERTCLTTETSKKRNPRKYIDFCNFKCAAQKAKCAHGHSAGWHPTSFSTNVIRCLIVCCAYPYASGFVGDAVEQFASDPAEFENAFFNHHAAWKRFPKS